MNWMFWLFMAVIFVCGIVPNDAHASTAYIAGSLSGIGGSLTVRVVSALLCYGAIVGLKIKVIQPLIKRWDSWNKVIHH